MKRKDVLLLLIPSLIFVIAWMGFSIYHGFINSTISEALNIQILPINPNFDTATITNLKSRTHVDPIYQLDSVLIISPTPGETPADNKKASQSAQTTTPIIDDSSSSQSTSGGTLSQ